MRPTRLELEGFISFRERTEIDFSNLDLFGITGPTGAGKTALIDGMIFALYGKTPRLGEKVVQELISQGASQMRVLLEFLCGDVAYRVLRIVKRKGAGRTQLERLREGEWEPIAGSTRELRTRVEEIVGLDFDGFTRTVVLPQGQFDRFLRGDGAARRKILSDLLGLDTYEQMMKRANEIARDATRQCDVLTEVVEQQFSAATPERLIALDAEILEAARERGSAAAIVAALEKALPLVIQLRQTEADHARYLTERDRLRKSLESAAAQVAGMRQTIEKTRRLLAGAGYDAARHLEVTSVLPVARRQSELQRAIASLKERRAQQSAEEVKLGKDADAARLGQAAAVESVKQAARAALKATDDWREFRASHGTADLLAEAAREAEAIPKIQQAIDTLQHQARQATDALGRTAQNYATLQTEALAAEDHFATARHELDHIRVMHAAAGVRQLLQAGEPCPVCLHPVDQVPPARESHPDLVSAEALLRTAEKNRESLRERAAKTRLELETLPAELKSYALRVDQFNQSLQAMQATVERLSGSRFESGQSPTAILTGLAAKAKAIESEALLKEKAVLAATASESAIRQELNKIETRVALCRQARESTERELAEKQTEVTSEWNLKALEAEAATLITARESHERLARELAAAERAINQAEVDERSFSERLSMAVATLAGLRERSDAMRAQLEGLPIDEGLEQRLAEARERSQQVEGKLTTAQMTREAVLNQAREAEGLALRVQQLEKEGAVHSKLGTMLRTDQFVGWILKDAFARLAYEGSKQLEALSNGRYTFAAGSDDFAVCDRWNAGERRSVNTLSGGESFLASLSLALGLSRGLTEFAANRDRFHLDSLFLDEGFSTLDAETLDTVLGAVEMLQADCRLIGVISHAAELADRLPGRIEVVKGANGSRLVLR